MPTPFRDQYARARAHASWGVTPAELFPAPPLPLMRCYGEASTHGPRRERHESTLPPFEPVSVDRLGWMPPSLQHAEPPRPLRKLVINRSPADANARSVLNARNAPAPTRCAVQLDHLRGGEAVASIASRWSRPGSSRHAKIRRLRLRHWSTSSILGSRT
jgi:hypothetical protein